MRPLALNIIWPLLLILLAGCAIYGGTQPQTPVQKMAYVDSQFTALVHTASDLRESGMMGDEHVDEVDRLIQSGNSALDAGWVAVRNGDEDATLRTLRVLNQVTLDLQKILTEVQSDE